MDSLDRKLANLTPEQLVELDRLLVGAGMQFSAWLPIARPTYTWSWRHLVLIQEALQRVFDGEMKRLMVILHPRLGKTEQDSVSFPVYWLEHRPQDRIIEAAYNATYARKIARKARRLARTRFKLNEERTAVEDWETLAGGGMRAVGVGEGVTGQGANLIIIDDPVKSREEAESEVYRDKTFEWYTDDLYTRLEPGGAIVLTMTRWHEDDIAGRILASEDGPNWEVLHIPALCDDLPDPLDRQMGEATCPERYDAEALARIRSVLGEYAFNALFQGRPTARTGGMFPADKVQIVDALPEGIKWVRYWDFAGTEGGGARTAGVKIGYHKGRFYVADVQLFQKAALERDQHVLLTAQLDRQAGGLWQIWREQEPGSSGKDGGSQFVRMLAGYSAHYEPATGDKIVRAEDSGWAAQWQAGNVSLLRGDWNKPYIDEHAAFGPGAKYKDQVDASVGGFTKVVKRPTLGNFADLLKESHWNL